MKLTQDFLLEESSALINSRELLFPDKLEAAKVIASSPFIANILHHHPEQLKQLVEDDALHVKRTKADYHQILKGTLTTEQGQYIKAIRRIRQKEMLRIAWRAISHRAKLEETLRETSAFADVCIQNAIQFLDDKLVDKYGQPLDGEGKKQSLQVIAVGKLGGNELNFSSDIDLIFAFPEENTISNDGKQTMCSQFFSELAQNLVKLLSEVTADGYVFRVDLRLRPNGQSGPLVMSFSALETYYQEQGRDWERYAMMKARLINASSPHANKLTNILEPFVYRRYVDFSVLETLRGMQQMIAREVKLKSLENDIKRGPGGIREIEFICQSLQLTRGGRFNALREKSLFKSLKALALKDFISLENSNVLRKAYVFLRQLENALQMYADKQTHTLPKDEKEQLCVAMQLGFTDWAQLIEELDKHRHEVEEQFHCLIDSRTSVYQDDKKLLQKQMVALFQGRLAEVVSEDLLLSLGFSTPSRTLGLLSELRQSKRVIRLSQIARLRLDEFMALLLIQLQSLDNVDVVFLRVFRLLEGIIQRSTYLALLMENPIALQHLLHLFSLSSWIALQVSEQPFLLEELLDEKGLYQPLTEKELHYMLLEGIVSDPSREDTMECLRQFKLTQTLKVAAADITETLSSIEVCTNLSRVAMVILRYVLDIAVNELSEKYPEMRGHPLDFAIIAYGRLGSAEMGYGSDLDLVFLHQYPSDKEYYVTRLTQRILHLLSVRMLGGVLYKVDTRLRPSGSAGLLVSHIDAFVNYQKNNAWTWEHQALVRAKWVAGSLTLKASFEELRQHILRSKRELKPLMNDIQEMRQRMESQKPHQQGFDIKHGRGGLIDVEFLVQYAVLRWSHDYPALTNETSTVGIIQLLIEHKLISKKIGEPLKYLYLMLLKYMHGQLLRESPLRLDDAALLNERNILGQLLRQLGLNF